MQEVELASSPLTVRCEKPPLRAVSGRRICNSHGVEIRVRFQVTFQPWGELLSGKAFRAEIRGQIVRQLGVSLELLVQALRGSRLPAALLASFASETAALL